MTDTFSKIMNLIANTLNILGLSASDVHEVTVSWRGRGTQTTYRVKIGNYTVGWRLEQEV